MLSIIKIGTILLNIEVIIFLFSTGASNSAAIVWRVYFVLSGLSDIILKPFMLGKGAVLPILVIFLGVIGGFIMSGFIGMFVGPIFFQLGIHYSTLGRRKNKIKSQIIKKTKVIIKKKLYSVKYLFYF